MTEGNGNEPEAPTELTRKWVKYVVGFGVSAVIGLAPFLGILEVPPFRPLLALFPELPYDTRPIVIPLSSFLMGVVAVSVQFFGGVGSSRTKLRRLFVRTLWIVLFSFLLFFVAYTLVVTVKPILGGQQEISVVTGFARPEGCKECHADMSNVECLDNTSLDPVRIRSCWSDKQINLGFLAFTLPYLVLTSGFGSLVGIVVLAEELRGKRS